MNFFGKKVKIFRFQFLVPRLMLLGPIKFTIEIATSFFKYLFFHHNYPIFILRPKIKPLLVCDLTIANSSLETKHSFCFHFIPTLNFWHVIFTFLNHWIILFLASPPFGVIHCHVLFFEIQCVQSLNHSSKWFLLRKFYNFMLVEFDNFI